MGSVDALPGDDDFVAVQVPPDQACSPAERPLRCDAGLMLSYIYSHCSSLHGCMSELWSCPAGMRHLAHSQAALPDCRGPRHSCSSWWWIVSFCVLAGAGLSPDAPGYAVIRRWTHLLRAPVPWRLMARSCAPSARPRHRGPHAGSRRTKRWGSLRWHKALDNRLQHRGPCKTVQSAE